MTDNSSMPSMDEKSIDDNTTSLSNNGSVAPLTAAEDRRLTTKIDFKLVPILGLLFVICFLNRTNIANARLAGLEAGLNMPSHGFNYALWIFYIPFVLAEVPSNMIMSLPNIRPDYWLGAGTFLLGVLAMCQGLTHSYEGLLAIRFLMGIFEASLPAGAGLLLVSYFRKNEIGFRFALFYAFGISGACWSGLLAYAITGMDGTAGYAGWRWIFILEGLVTIFFSFFVIWLCPNFPTQDRRMKEADRANLLARLEADKGTEKLDLVKVPWVKVIFEYKTWLLTLLFFCADMSAGSLASFNPTILSQLGWTSRHAQVMTIPVWLVGIVGSFFATFISGRINLRWPFIHVAIVCSSVGWTIHFLQVQPTAVRYFAQFLISFGTFVQLPMYIGLLMANLRGRAYLSFATAVQFGVGNAANFVAANVFIKGEAPQYPTGFGTGLGMTIAAVPLLFFCTFLFWRHNKKIDARLAAGEILDDQVDYKYVL